MYKWSHGNFDNARGWSDEDNWWRRCVRAYATKQQRPSVATASVRWQWDSKCATWLKVARATCYSVDVKDDECRRSEDRSNRHTDANLFALTVWAIKTNCHLKDEDTLVVEGHQSRDQCCGWRGERSTSLAHCSGRSNRTYDNVSIRRCVGVNRKYSRDDGSMQSTIMPAFAVEDHILISCQATLFCLWLLSCCQEWGLLNPRKETFYETRCVPSSIPKDKQSFDILHAYAMPVSFLFAIVWFTRMVAINVVVTSGQT